VVSDATVCGLADQAVHCAPLESGKSFERIQALNGAARIALSDSWLCSIDVRGQVACTKPANQAGKPVPLAGSVPFVDLALSGERICVLDQQGAVRCAYASDPNLGSPMLGDVTRIGGGNCHFSALTLKGEVYSWGCNHAGQAGASVRPFSVVPTPLQRGKASG
jgi:hypothetical protein